MIVIWLKWWRQVHPIGILRVELLLIKTSRVVRVHGSVEFIEIIIGGMSIATSVKLHLLEMSLNLLLLPFAEKFKLLHDVSSVWQHFFTNSSIRLHVNILLD